jgi:hypothetical protein
MKVSDQLHASAALSVQNIARRTYWTGVDAVVESNPLVPAGNRTTILRSSVPSLVTKLTQLPIIQLRSATCVNGNGGKHGDRPRQGTGFVCVLAIKPTRGK